MAKDLPPAPFSAPIIDERTAGVITPIWSDWFKKAFIRMGGSIAPTNNDPITSSRIAAGAVNNAAIGSAAVAISNLASAVLATLVPTGSVQAFAGSSAPTGFLLCDGSAISRTTYSALFAVIGTTWGAGDGSTTFNVPNAKGVFIRGAGSQTISAISYSGTLGAAQGDQIQGHFHSLSGNGAAQLSGVSNTNVTGAGPAVSGTSTIGAPTTDGANGTPRTGAETRPANIAMNWIIKT